MEWFLLLLIWPLDGGLASEPVRVFLPGLESQQACEEAQADMTARAAAELASDGNTTIRIRYKFQCISLPKR